MNSLGEFRIDEVKGIKAKIDYVRISNQQYRSMSYEQLLSVLIQMMIDCERANSLEAARLIKFHGDKTKTTKEYKGYVYVIPERDTLKIDKIIKILNVVYGNPELVYVKFVGEPEKIIENKKYREHCNIGKKEQQSRKKLEEEKLLVAEKIFGMNDEISDIKLAKEIAASDDNLVSIGIRLSNLDRERQAKCMFEMERKYSHIKWMLNDTKQAELFGVPLEEYRNKFREKNIMADELTSTFIGYVKILQSNFNCGYIIEDYIYDNVEFEPTFENM